jgi:hypothetical protein
MELTDTFTSRAADLIKLMAWLQGDEFKLKLMIRCYSLSKSDKVNRATVERALDEMTADSLRVGQ